MTRETIVALATPPGRSALATIRLSGAASRSIIEPLLDRPIDWRPGRANYRTLRQGETVLDDAVITYWAAPRSATGEEVIELSVHGNPRLVQTILQVLLESGARLARPGEFTERAVLNDKLSLTQAEGLLELLHASTDRALRHAREMKEGKLGQALDAMRRELIDLLSHAEAALDFAEEGIEPQVGAEFRRRLEALAVELQALLQTAPLGRLLHEGALVVIIGRPNVGKSSLLNALLQEERAIVAPTPGTTRDLVEASCSIRGLPVRLVDTAGQRESIDPIEQEGVRRARSRLGEAQLALHVVEAPQPFAPMTDLPGDLPLLIVANKMDLGADPSLPSDALRVSAQTGAGLEELRRRIETALLGEAIPNEAMPLAINARQNATLSRSAAALRQAQAALADELGLEIVSLELREVLRELGEVIGSTDNEAVLDQLFRNFCIGK